MASTAEPPVPSVAEGDSPLITLYGKDVAAIVIFLIGLVGVSGNVTIAFFTRKLPTMNNPFGRLLASQASGEAVLCSCFAFYVAPMMFFDSPFMIKYSYNAGWINLICYDICTWSHFFISINRFVAICTPTRYEKVFSDFTRDISFVFIIGIIDIITIFKVHRLNKSVAVSQAQLARRQREVNFLKQAILQMLVFVAELCTYFQIMKYFMDRRWIFWMLTSVAWVCVHTIDGLIILFFNREFRKLIIHPLQKLCFVVVKDSTAYNTTSNPQGFSRNPSGTAFTS